MYLTDFKILKTSKNLFCHLPKIMIFDENEHEIWPKLLIIPKLWKVTKSVFVTKT